MSTPLNNDVVRRVKHETSLFKIVEVSLLAGDTEKFEVTARNPRHTPVEFKFTLEEALRVLCPELYEENAVDVDSDAPPVSGSVDLEDLSSCVMVDGRLNDSERARLWKIIREVQTGQWPGEPWATDAK